MDMAVKSPSPSVHNPLLGDLTSPHNPLGIQVSKGVDTGFVNSNSKTDEGTEVARQVSIPTWIKPYEGWVDNFGKGLQQLS